MSAEPSRTLTQQIALWADALRDLSAMALRFSKNPYDREHYETVQQIALEMLALATGQLPAALEPMRAEVMRHPTPFATGDAAVINPRGELLLIRRADNGMWAMPGGALAVGETPAEGAERETFEETGVRCRAVALIGVHDSRYCGSLTPHHLYHFLFLCEPIHADAADHAPSHAHEVLAAGWFAADALPSEIDPGHRTRIPEAFRVWRGDGRAYFDAGDESPANNSNERE